MRVEPVTLAGKRVVLEPLRPEHGAELWPAARGRDSWTYMTELVNSPSDLDGWIANRVAAVAAGTGLAFLQRDADGGAAMGTTSLFDIDPVHRKMEIGFTWLGPDHRGGGRNLEAKLLLLTHAFDTLGAYRVQWKTDARNAAALRALEHIGATREGTLRSFNVMPDGHRRDAVFFSVLDREWPAVRDALQARLAAHPWGRPDPPHARTPDRL